MDPSPAAPNPLRSTHGPAQPTSGAGPSTQTAPHRTNCTAHSAWTGKSAFASPTPDSTWQPTPESTRQETSSRTGTSVGASNQHEAAPSRRDRPLHPTPKDTTLCFLARSTTVLTRLAGPLPRLHSRPAVRRPNRQRLAGYFTGYSRTADTKGAEATHPAPAKPVSGADSAQPHRQPITLMEDRPPDGPQALRAGPQRDSRARHKGPPRRPNDEHD